MLDPMDRENLLEALRPEAGQAFDLAVGTSFSVDLEALMFAPLAFALFDVEGPPDPTALLAAIQQNAARLALYCDRAQVRPPAAGQKLFALLEPTLLPVRAPRGGAFHPKLWVLRYRDAGGGRRHRVLVLSRNLTHDTSWDLAVRFDEDEEGAPLGRDVAAALTALDELRPSPLARELAGSIARARFALPRPFEEARLRLLGGRAEGGAADPLAEVRGERLLVVSPFLAAGRLEELRARASRDGRLVSRPSELERMGGRALEGWRTPLVLHEAADPQADAGGGEAALRGLHAKLVAVDRGERTTWFVGS
ncbi:MAG TPA: phospholipase D family protein, partial [Solirubrobacterales bacterium]